MVIIDSSSSSKFPDGKLMSKLQWPNGQNNAISAAELSMRSNNYYNYSDQDYKCCTLLWLRENPFQV